MSTNTNVKAKSTLTTTNEIDKGDNDDQSLTDEELKQKAKVLLRLSTPGRTLMSEPDNIEDEQEVDKEMNDSRNTSLNEYYKDKAADTAGSAADVTQRPPQVQLESMIERKLHEQQFGIAVDTQVPPQVQLDGSIERKLHEQQYRTNDRNHPTATPKLEDRAEDNRKPAAKDDIFRRSAKNERERDLTEIYNGSDGIPDHILNIIEDNDSDGKREKQFLTSEATRFNQRKNSKDGEENGISEASIISEMGAAQGPKNIEGTQSSSNRQANNSESEATTPGVVAVPGINRDLSDDSFSFVDSACAADENVVTNENFGEGITVEAHLVDEEAERERDRQNRANEEELVRLRSNQELLRSKQEELDRLRANEQEVEELRARFQNIVVADTVEIVGGEENGFGRKTKVEDSTPCQRQRIILGIFIIIFVGILVGSLMPFLLNDEIALSESPSDIPSAYPTDIPTTSPSDIPSISPTDIPTTSPTDIPTTPPTSSSSPTSSTSPTDIFKYLGEFVCSIPSPCGLCEGDCNSDSDCQGGLTCFQRDGSVRDEVPGCGIVPDYAMGVGTDFCCNETVNIDGTT